MSEESKLVESAQEQETTNESTQETQGFNAEAFLSGLTNKEGDAQYNEETAQALDDKEAQEESNDSEEATEDVDGFSWGSVETEKATEEESEPEETWNFEAATEETSEATTESEESGVTNEIDWSAVANELGFKATNKEEMQAIVQQMQDFSNQPTQAPADDVISQLESFAKMSDRELLMAEYEQAGHDKKDIEAYLDSMEDGGKIKFEASRIRRLINGEIDRRKQALVEGEKQEAANRAAKVNENKKALQDTLKKMDEFMGGRVSKAERENVYRYITSGDMAKEIWKDHANAAEVGLFLLFKDKFAKILRSQGVEEGKASILGSITNTDLNTGSKSVFKGKTSGFDRDSFLKGLS
jgi:hypothetical protein